MSPTQHVSTETAGTLNEWSGVPHDHAAIDLDAFLELAPAGVRVGLVGLQEWRNARNKILRARGTLSRFPAISRRLRPGTARPFDGFAWGRPIIGGPPVGARSSRYELLVVRSKVLARPGRVDKSPGRRAFLGHSRATIGVYFDHETGTIVDVVNYHLTANVQLGRTGYRSDRPKRVKRHRGEVRRLRRIVEARLRLGHRVVAVGDSNYHDLEIPGLDPAFGPGDPGTLGRHRRIDNVHADGEPLEVARYSGRSDHDGIAVARRVALA